VGMGPKRDKGSPMPVMQPSTGPIEITDPNNVAEVLINGPFNIINNGGMVHITFTNVRPDDSDLFSGKNPPRLRGAVACRLLMPTGVANHACQSSAQHRPLGLPLKIDECGNLLPNTLLKHSARRLARVCQAFSCTLTGDGSAEGLVENVRTS
jgi:hypothetical protein